MYTRISVSLIELTVLKNKSLVSLPVYNYMIILQRCTHFLTYLRRYVYSFVSCAIVRSYAIIHRRKCFYFPQKTYNFQ